MSNQLDAIKAKLRESQNKGGNREQGQRSTGDNASFPFWNIPVGSTATIRFLPDADPDNILFWRERQIIKLPFQGVVGGEYPTSKQVEVQVPCIDMFGMNCPIIAHIRPWWKEPGKEDLARTYYKKRSFIFQGFVVNSSLEETAPENPIRRFVLNKSIYDIVEKSLMDPEFEDAPTDYANGVDFKINKTQQGQYASYTTSNWARRPRSLSESELIAIEQHGLFNLKDYLGRVPDQDEIDAIVQMFHDSLDGKPFDAESFGKYYRAFGSRDDAGGDTGAVAAARATAAASSDTASSYQRPAPVTVAEPTVTETATPAASGGSAHDILERIKNRVR